MILLLRSFVFNTSCMLFFIIGNNPRLPIVDMTYLCLLVYWLDKICKKLICKDLGVGNTDCIRETQTLNIVLYRGLQYKIVCIRSLCIIKRKVMMVARQQVLNISVANTITKHCMYYVKKKQIGDKWKAPMVTWRFIFHFTVYWQHWRFVA